MLPGQPSVPNAAGPPIRLHEAGVGPGEKGQDPVLTHPSATATLGGNGSQPGSHQKGRGGELARRHGLGNRQRSHKTPLTLAQESSRPVFQAPSHPSPSRLLPSSRGSDLKSQMPKQDPNAVYPRPRGSPSREPVGSRPPPRRAHRLLSEESRPRGVGCGGSGRGGRDDVVGHWPCHSSC